MAAYNAERFLRKTLDSLRAQTFPDYELIFVDDGSEDKTWAIAKQYAEKDTRIKVFQNSKNQGLVHTRNRCLAECVAPYVAIADADDILHPERFERQLQFMEAHPDIGVLGSNVSLIDDEGRPLGSSMPVPIEDRHIRFLLLLGPCICNTTTFYRRGELEKVGGYSLGFETGAEDYDLWAKLLKQTRFSNLTEELVFYRRHPDSVTAGENRALPNIFTVSSCLLSEYLGFKVDKNLAAKLTTFLWLGLQKTCDDRSILQLALALKKQAGQKEEIDTLQILDTMLYSAIWTHANQTVYFNRRFSFALAAQSIRLYPKTLFTRRFLNYAVRWIVPDGIRLLFKQMTLASH